MPATRVTILSALRARLSALPANALRGEVLPERVPTEGLLILRDGEPGDPEVTLSPLAYHYQHRADIEVVVQTTDRGAAFDTLTASIGAALAADRTLGGLCDWVEAEAPRPVDLPVDGGGSLKAWSGLSGLLFDHGEDRAGHPAKVFAAAKDDLVYVVCRGEIGVH